MSRVLLVGAGPLPGPGQRRVGFPQLRTAWLARALGAGGHDVALACLRRGEGGPPTEPGPLAATVRDIAAERGAWIEELRALGRAWKPDAWVAAGPYTPPQAAALAVGEEPLWADIPGDPFAEAQALAARLGPTGEPLPAAPGAAH
ncbi:MAG: glycosyltransferase, partial [Pseudomonadota bacterium]